MPKTREDFWRKKFEGNVRRDAKVRDDALRLGWRVATIWECSLRNPGQIGSAASAVIEWLKSDRQMLEIGAQVFAAIECPPNK